MTYADYEFYSQTWGGKLTESAFAQSEPRAEFLLNQLTKGRIPLIWDDIGEQQKAAISMATCVLVDGYVTAKVQDAEKASETVGKHSVTYAAMTQSRTARMRNAIRPYLDGITCNGVSLLYRGLEEASCCACRK